MKELSELLKNNNFKFNKSFGQNFITDVNLLSAICRDAEIGEEDIVIEIGAGGGTLTAELARRAKRVIAFEIDRNLKPILSESLAEFENAEVVFSDFLKEDIRAVNERAGGPFKVVANLPYYITTPLILKLIEEGANVTTAVVMVQKEVAQRLCAKENTEQYGAVTVAVDSVADCKLTRVVGRKMFYPVPNVDSAVVKMEFKHKYEIEDRELFKKVYRSAFLMRRKTLCNNLIGAFGFSRDRAEECLKGVGIDISARGETLSTADFVRLYRQIVGML